MKIFDKQGMFKIPEPGSKIPIEGKGELLSVCNCHNGHSLLSPRVMFNGKQGILLRVIKAGKKGYIGLSPVINDKSRISVDIDLQLGESYDLACPECGELLPAFAPCPCGGMIIAMRTSGRGEFIGVCNMAGCPNAMIIPNEDLLRKAGLFL